MPICCQYQHTNTLHKIWCADCDSLMQGARVGDCTVVKYIGQGSTGSIYLARQHSLDNRKVVVKVLRSLPSQTNVENFRREAELLAKLRHPYILPIYGFDIVEEKREEPLAYVPYLILPYAEQGSLEDAFEREGGWPWPLERVLPIVSEAAEALAYAHECRILHRDVKPGNILLSGTHVMLADFGVATLIDVEISHLSAPWAGSPAYMAPEVWHYVPGRYSDQYALAITCYRLLTGTYPWRVGEDESAQGWMNRHCYVAPRSLRSQRADLSPELDAVVLHALAKDPHERYGGVSEFATELCRVARSPLPSGAGTTPQTPLSLPTSGPALNASSPARLPLLVEGRPTEAALVAIRTLEVEEPEAVVGSGAPVSVLEAIGLEGSNGPVVDRDVAKESTSLLASPYHVWLPGGFVLDILICCVLLGWAWFTGGMYELSEWALPLWPCLLIGSLLGLCFDRTRPSTFSWGVVYGMFFGIANTLIALPVCWLWGAVLATLFHWNDVGGWAGLPGEVGKVLGELPLPGLIGLWVSVLGGILLGLLAARQERLAAVV